jgi:hypothetical protein
MTVKKGFVPTNFKKYQQEFPEFPVESTMFSNVSQQIIDRKSSDASSVQPTLKSTDTIKHKHPIASDKHVKQHKQKLVSSKD